LGQFHYGIIQWIWRGVNLKCIDAYAVLECENDTKFHVFATKHKANTCNEQSTHSDNCACFVLELTSRHFCDVIWSPRIVQEWASSLITFSCLRYFRNEHVWSFVIIHEILSTRHNPNHLWRLYLKTNVGVKQRSTFMANHQWKYNLYSYPISM
jgi:hypothetical protein